MTMQIYSDLVQRVVIADRVKKRIFMSLEKRKNKRFCLDKRKSSKS